MSDTAPDMAPRRRRRGRALLVVLAAFVLLYTLAGFIGVPWALRRWVVPAVDERLAGSLRIDGISCNPFTFAIALGPGELLDPQGRRVLAFERVHANFDPGLSLLTRSWRFAELSVTAPALDVDVDESGEPGIVTALASTAPSAPADPDAPLLRSIPRVRIGHGAVRNASLRLTDRSRRRPVEAQWRGIDFTFDNLDLAPLRRSGHRLVASSADGARLEWEGWLVTEPATAHGSLRLTGFNVAPLMPYLATVTTAEVVGGTLDASLAYELAPTDHPPIARLVVHDASMTDLRLLDPTLDEGIPLLDAPKVRVVDARVDLVGRSATIASVRVNGGALHVGRDEGGDPAILRLFPVIAAEAEALVPDETGAAPDGGDGRDASDGAAAGAGAAAPSGGDVATPEYPVERVAAALTLLLRRATEGWDVDLESIALHGPTIRFTDRSTRRVIELRLDDTELTAGPIRSTDAFATPFELEGRMSGATAAAPLPEAPVSAASGSFSLKGVLRPLETGLDVAVDAERIPLTPFAPYLPQRPLPNEPPMELTDGTATVRGRANAIVRWETRELSVDWDGFAGVQSLRLDLEGATAPLAALDGVEATGRLTASLATAKVDVRWKGAAGFERIAVDAPLEPAPIVMDVGSGRAEGSLELRLREDEGAALTWSGPAGISAFAVATGRERPDAATVGAEAIRYDGAVEAGSVPDGRSWAATRGELSIEDTSLAATTPGAGAVTLGAAALAWAGDARIDAEPGSDGRLTLRGDATGRELHLDAPAIDDAKVSVREWRIADLDADSSGPRASIRELSATGASAELERVLIPRPESTAATDAAAGDTAPAADAGTHDGGAAPSSASATPHRDADTTGAGLPDLSISRIVLDDATLLLVDHSTEPPARLLLSGVRAEIDALATRGDAPATLAVNGLVQESGRFDLRGSLHPLEPARSTAIELTVTALPLKPYDPYAHRFVGYEIDTGRLTLGLPVTVRDFTLDGTLDATLDRFYLGAERLSPEAPNLPLRLGLDLLRDGNERIAVNVPFHGDLRDPSFELGGVIWQAVINLLVKATTAPFTLLGALVGAGDRDLSTVPFEPGSAEVPPERLADLDLLAKALSERPAIGLRAVGTWTAADLDALKAAAEGGDVDPAALEALAKARAEAVVRILVGQGVDASRAAAEVAAGSSEEPPRVTFELR